MSRLSHWLLASAAVLLCLPAALAWTEGQDLKAPDRQLARPGLNLGYTDPAYGSRITRISDPSQAGAGSGVSWIRHEYSRRPAFNSNGTRMLMLMSNGYYALYAVNAASNSVSLIRVTRLDQHMEPNWHPSNPNLIYHFPSYGMGMRILLHDITTGSSVAHRDLDANGRLTRLYPGAVAAWTRWEGRPSNDGRTWCVQLRDAADRSLALVAYRLDTDTVVGHLDIRGLAGFDHVSASPLGTRCVASFDHPVGIRAYTTRFDSHTLLNDHHDHYDLGLKDAATEVAVVASTRGAGGFNLVNLATGATTRLLDMYLPNATATAAHVSMVGSRGTPGWALISTYACGQAYGTRDCLWSAQWYKDKVFLVSLGTPTRVVTLAHTRNPDAVGVWSASPKPYFLEPQASSNGDYSKVVFASGWWSVLDSSARSYLIDVPVAQFAGGAGTGSASLAIRSATARRTGLYTADLAVATTQGAQCRMTTVPPTLFAAAYDDFSTGDGLNHAKPGISLTGGGTHTRYAICRSRSSGAEVAATVVVPAN